MSDFREINTSPVSEFQPPKNEMDDPDHPWLQEQRAKFQGRFRAIVPDPDLVLDGARRDVRRAPGRCDAVNIVGRAFGVHGANVVPLLLTLEPEDAANLSVLIDELLESPYVRRYLRANRIQLDTEGLSDNAIYRPIALALNHGLIDAQWERKYSRLLNQGIRQRVEAQTRR